MVFDIYSTPPTTHIYLFLFIVLFSSLRLQNMVEYLEPAIDSGLKDPSGYVRKTAVMGCAKLHCIDPCNIPPDDDKVFTTSREKKSRQQKNEQRNYYNFDSLLMKI